jgi:uncharacterized protein YjbI with pentapeptide repeats
MAWNEWRRSLGSGVPSLRRADLRGLKAKSGDSYSLAGGIDLRRIDLRAAELASAELDGSLLGNADLRRANLSGASLVRADLHHADLSGSNLRGADLSGARVHFANLERADLSGADLTAADFANARLRRAALPSAFCRAASFIDADLRAANLTAAILESANLTGAIMDGARLEGSDLTAAQLVRTNLRNAKLSRSLIYGISVWNAQLQGAEQLDLRVTQAPDPVVTVDNIEVAQFVYLLLRNERLRHVIETVSSRAVLILGRFTPKRKGVLDAIRQCLRSINHVPILFDFQRPSSRDFTETVKTLALLSKFIIADLSSPRSIPQELQAIVPETKVPVQPIIYATQKPYAMFADFVAYPWMLELLGYSTEPELSHGIKTVVLPRVEAKLAELSRLRFQNAV